MYSRTLVGVDILASFYHEINISIKLITTVKEVFIVGQIKETIVANPIL